MEVARTIIIDATGQWRISICDDMPGYSSGYGYYLDRVVNGRHISTWADGGYPTRWEARKAAMKAKVRASC